MKGLRGFEKQAQTCVLSVRRPNNVPTPLRPDYHSHVPALYFSAGFSACLKELRKARGYTGKVAAGRFSPRCLPDGSYDRLQCLDGDCWCVDHDGVEVVGTRTQGRPSCYAGAGTSLPLFSWSSGKRNEARRNERNETKQSIAKRTKRSITKRCIAKRSKAKRTDWNETELSETDVTKHSETKEAKRTK